MNFLGSAIFMLFAIGLMFGAGFIFFSSAASGGAGGMNLLITGAALSVVALALILIVLLDIVAQLGRANAAISEQNRLLAKLVKRD